MASSQRLILHLHLGAEDDTGDLDELTVSLRSDLQNLDVQNVERLPADAIPEGAKGLADVAGWLAVNVGPDAIRLVLSKLADWVGRNQRDVEVTYGTDTLKLSKATREQQERIIDGWLARHPSASGIHLPTADQRFSLCSWPWPAALRLAARVRAAPCGCGGGVPPRLRAACRGQPG